MGKFLSDCFYFLYKLGRLSSSKRAVEKRSIRTLRGGEKSEIRHCEEKRRQIVGFIEDLAGCVLLIFL